MVVPPEKVFKPLRIRVPLPALVRRLFAPEIMPLTVKLAVPMEPPLLTVQV